MNDDPLKDYDRSVRVAQTYEEITQNRSGYFLSELVKRAQSLVPKLKADDQIVLGAIQALTGAAAPDYKQVLLSLLRILTPAYYRTKFIQIYCPENASYAKFGEITLPQIMVHLWQSLEDERNGYPIELEVANAVTLIVQRITTEEGELNLWEENLKITQENK